MFLLVRNCLLVTHVSSSTDSSAIRSVSRLAHDIITELETTPIHIKTALVSVTFSLIRRSVVSHRDVALTGDLGTNR